MKSYNRLQELDESRRKRETEITEINQELEGEYKAKLQEALHQMREQLDTQIRINRKEIEEMYEAKVKVTVSKRQCIGA